jgi:NAD(P)-dependent dehydrogenase (short-subunit alcohol dehydrogenase family)
VTAAAKRLPGNAVGVQLDVTDEGAVRTFFAGQGRFDHLVYTAGEALLLGPLAALSPEQARALALELAPVRVNAVRPGAVRSGMWTDTVPDPETVYADFASRSPLARVAEPEDIAAAYVFLMTSSNTTGTILTCDGGAALL